jgi:hypothetical protein
MIWPGLAEIATQDPPPPGTPTDLWAVILTPGADPAAVADRLGFEYVGPAGSLQDTYAFRKPGTDTSPEAAQEAAELLANAPEVVYFEQQLAQPVELRDDMPPATQQQLQPENPEVADAGTSPNLFFWVIWFIAALVSLSF